jgi:hypothetical protein
MGIIREPKAVDLTVAPSVWTEEDKNLISEIIANYKKTGRKPAKKCIPKLRATKQSR